jgi:hypothetical protein
VGELSEACWLTYWQKAPRRFPQIHKCFRAFATRSAWAGRAGRVLGDAVNLESMRNEKKKSRDYCNFKQRGKRSSCKQQRNGLPRSMTKQYTLALCVLLFIVQLTLLKISLDKNHQFELEMDSADPPAIKQSQCEQQSNDNVYSNVTNSAIDTPSMNIR